MTSDLLGISGGTWALVLDIIVTAGFYFLMLRLGQVLGKVMLLKAAWIAAREYAEFWKAHVADWDDTTNDQANAFMHGLMSSAEYQEEVTRSYHPFLSRFLMPKTDEEERTI